MVVAEAAAAAAVLTALCQLRQALRDPPKTAYTVTSSNDVKEIYTALNDAAGRLGAKRADYQNAVEREKTQMPTESYDHWIGRVITIEAEVKKLLARYDEASKWSRTVFKFLHPNFRKKMKRKGEKIMRLLEECTQLGEILVDRPAPKHVFDWTAPNIEKYSTLQTALNETLILLKKDKVKIIAIKGLLGTGKTAIMKNLNNHEAVVETFDMVMWINVSAGEDKGNLDMSQLQNAIAKRLKVDMKGANDSDNITHRISNELKGKRYLLLLDNVKPCLHIYQMGIPPCENGSKIVLTTRSDHVCLPKVDRLVKVAHLTPKESFRMFQDVANCPKLKENLKAERCARRIIKECGGHPLLINIIASVFRTKDLELWSEGFKSLNRFSEKDHHGLNELRNVIKFCYDDLEDTQRKCLLYGVLYPEEINICKHFLLECWEAEDLLGNGDDAKEAKMRGLHVLNHLQKKSLIEEDESQKYITMHKCIRQVLLSMLSKDPNCKLLVQETPPDAQCWRDKIWISLVKNEFDELPECPNCGSLSTLFLQDNSALRSIPALFFEHLTSLKILDLCHTKIELLPSSLSKVIGLKVLYLNYCEHLKELPFNEEDFKHLEVLDIRASGFNNIPSYIENLKGLRRFRVSIAKCGSENDTRVVEFNWIVISKLSKLEELVIDVKSRRHQSNEVVVNIIKNVVALKNLKRLQFCFLGGEVVNVIEAGDSTDGLQIHVPEADILHTYIEETRPWRNIQYIRFQFFIGCLDSKYPRFPRYFEFKRYVNYCNGVGSDHPIFAVLANVDAFELENKDIKQLSELKIPSMNKLQACQIKSCSALETAVESKILPNMEHLFLKDLPNLQKIWNGPVDPASLTKLKTLVLSSCQTIEIIFPSDVIQHLCEIECLKIEDCSEIVEVVKESTTVKNQDLLPKLKKIVLRGLPKLKSICADESSKWPALEKLKILNCPALPNLPFNKDAEKLKKLILLDMPKLDSICSNESLKWPALKKLKIHKCPALLKLPFSKDNAENLKLIEAEEKLWKAL